MPGLEADLESETSTTRKRKRGGTKEDEVRRLEEELELIMISMEELDMGSRLDGMPDLDGDKKDSLNVPVSNRRMETSPVRRIISKFEESLRIVTVNEVPNAKFEKSPIKILIEKYENLKVENESNNDSVQCVQNMGTECGPSEVYESCAKPEDNATNSLLLKSVPVVSNAKPAVKGRVSRMTSMKGKKKVWGVKSNGLYGWKMVVVDQITSENIHTQNINTQPTSTSKLKSIPQQNILLKNWLVAPKQKVGGGGISSDILEVNTWAKSARIGNNRNLEKTHTIGFNNPGPDGKSPAKLTGLAENESKP